MNKLKQFILPLVLLSILILLVSCAPKTEYTGDVTPEEAAAVSTEEGKTLAGQAVKVNFENCADPDATSQFDQNQLLTKSVTTFGSGSREDKCYTWNKGTPSEKTRLIEGTCKQEGGKSKFIYWYADCDVTFGKGTKCVDGACVPSCDPIQLSPYCTFDTLNNVDTLVDVSKNPCTGLVNVVQTSCPGGCTNGDCIQGGSSGGGGGYGFISGDSCEADILVINKDKKYDCSKEAGWIFKAKTCAPPIEEYSSLVKYVCAEACTPGQTAISCDEDGDFHEQTCNQNGFGWSLAKKKGCPEGQTCKVDPVKKSGICK
ncbi:hypothetical protein HYX14_02860 [Candidatus Woesearchaeota archaeon]|nr:hypothetical protein [Candidatus Woesearchaeota archaeon]